MAKKEKIGEERRKLIKEFISSNELKTAGDVEEALKNLFKDTLQEMLKTELTEHLGYGKNEYTYLLLMKFLHLFQALLLFFLDILITLLSFINIILSILFLFIKSGTKSSPIPSILTIPLYL